MPAEQNVGEELRLAREQRRLSIRQLSNLTKISPSILQAIEKNDAQHVPGGLFIRGFLRAYAREVGLDPEATVTRYGAQFQDSEQPQPAELLQAEESADQKLRPSDLRYVRVQALAAVAVLAISVVAYFALIGQPAPGAVPLTATTYTIDTQRPVATAGSVQDPNAVSIESTDLRMMLEPQGPCWIAAAADGKPVVSRLMNAGERQAIEARDAIALRVGDPASLAFSVNGAPGRPLGRAGEPVNVRITRENYRDYLGR